MNANLARALQLLDITAINLLNDQGVPVRKVSAKEHAEALFTYLDLAGYLDPVLLEKAIDYLAAEQPFSVPNETLIEHLTNVYQTAHQSGRFDTTYFLEHFCKEDYYQINDIIDLVVFLQQTAFDREFGVERDRLQAKPWLEQHAELFQELAANLGVMTPLPPVYKSYSGTGIMGAASTRVRTRIEYFHSLQEINCGDVWALSGNRELSQGLDEPTVMEKVAHAVGKPVSFVKKGTGAAERTFLDGITETMMVNYLIETMCPGKKIALIDSAIEEGHWRATTTQNAKDIARVFVQKIETGQITKQEGEPYRFMIIAEQPYAGRMARSVQRAFNLELQSRGLSIQIQVDGVGAGLGPCNKDLLARVNSELASLMAERFNDARLKLQQDSHLVLRDSKIIMFSSRNNTYEALKDQASKAAAADVRSMGLTC